jgi:hypothetical protein
MERKLLKLLTKNIMRKNSEFRGLHSGDECYIFGNGNSLKYFDLGLFSDKISFGCNVLRVHNDFSKLNLKYYVSTHPLLYSPYWRGVKTGFYLEKNPFYQLQKSFENIGYIHFVHASNYFFINDKKNYRFLHNLDKFSMNLDFNDITTSSSFVGGGLTTMIGLAMYMGFKKVYLVGCDYFFKPYIGGHFWSKLECVIGNYDFFYKELMDITKDVIDLTVITRKGISSNIKSIQYEDLFNVKENYTNADEIVSQSDLNTIDKTLYLRK